MAQAQHTPGPWHRGADGRIVYDSAGWAISNAVTFHGKHKSGEDFANARLIAAAPELVEALAYLLEQTIEQDERHGIGLTEGERDAARIARALLARINGGAV